MDGWAVAAVGLYATSRWGARKRQARREPIEWTVDEGIITFDQHLTDAEIEEIRSRWLDRYGKPGTAHPVEPLDEGNPDA